jgi:hypothetical protein
MKLLSTTRSEYTDVAEDVLSEGGHPAPETKRLKLQKYASMGNGTTFVVQTVVYYALARLACKRAGCSLENIAVFGDDIILPSFAAPHLTEMFQYCGLMVNDEKSFISGPVRESCGGDYYRGFNIRPVFYRKDYHDDLAGFLAMRNLLWLWSRETGNPLTGTLSFLDSYINAVPTVPLQAGLTAGRWASFEGPWKNSMGTYQTLVWVDPRAKQKRRFSDDTFRDRTKTDFLFAKMCAHLDVTGAAFQWPPDHLRVRLTDTLLFDCEVQRDSLVLPREQSTGSISMATVTG